MSKSAFACQQGSRFGWYHHIMGCCHGCTACCVVAMERIVLLNQA